MIKRRHLMALFCASLMGFSGAAPAWAQITLNKNSDMHFGKVEYSSSHNGAVRLGTNGNVSVIGSGLVYVSGGNAANVSVTAGNSDVIEIKCDTSGTLTPDGGGSELTIENTEVAINSGTAFGSGQECHGIGGADQPAATVDLSVTANPTILIGGEVVIPANELSALEYSTGNAGGSPITLSVTFQ